MTDKQTEGQHLIDELIYSETETSKVKALREIKSELNRKYGKVGENQNNIDKHNEIIAGRTEIYQNGRIVNIDNLDQFEMSDEPDVFTIELNSELPYLNKKELDKLNDYFKNQILKEIKIRLEELDDKLIRAIGQYKLVQAGYIYGRMTELNKFDDNGTINSLPGVEKLRNFFNEMRKSDLYKNAR